MPPPAAPRPARIAAIRPGFARRRLNSRSTSGQTWFSIRSCAASGVASSSAGEIAGAKETWTFIGFGNQPQANSLSVPVIAHGTIGAPASIASRPTPRRGSFSVAGSRWRVPSGNIASTRPFSRCSRAVSSASGSAVPRRTGNAPSPLSSRAVFLPSKSSVFAMKCRCRVVASPMKNES